jgi:hypothetical protein
MARKIVNKCAVRLYSGGRVIGTARSIASAKKRIKRMGKEGSTYSIARVCPDKEIVLRRKSKTHKCTVKKRGRRKVLSCKVHSAGVGRATRKRR